MSRQVPVDNGLWKEFHRVVNMSSRELVSWLRTTAAGQHSEQSPDHAAPETGRRVVQILRKRRTDLDVDDELAMRTVVDTVRAEHAAECEPAVSTGEWRHRLMSLGHDPLRMERKFR